MFLFEHRSFSLKSDHLFAMVVTLAESSCRGKYTSYVFRSLDVASTNEEEHTFLLVVFYCTDQSISRAGTEMPKATKP